MILSKEQIEVYKKRLTEDRKQTVKALQKPSVRGVWGQIVDKYSDQAHFLYEIVQNADDAEATYSRFVLKDDELIFSHNGKRLFDISDVDKEADDRKKGYLGDINAITSIGQSTKIDPAKIGKFGMGFKSVFQYTATPRIYDNEFKFKIVDYMVPEWLEDDYPSREDGETVFVFPFNRNDCPPDKAKEEILEKLQKLVMPILFLHSIKKLSMNAVILKVSTPKNVLKKNSLKIQLQGNMK